MNAAQCKMARAALDLGVREVATLANVSPDTIARLERGEALKESTVAAIRAAFESAGVIFVEENGEGPGVRLRKAMNNDPIYVDASYSAQLNHGTTTVDCFTLQEAVLEFERLAVERQEIASISYRGRKFKAAEIRRLHYGPKPEA